LKYAFIYGGNESATTAFGACPVAPIQATDVAGNVVAEPQWVMFNVEPTEDGKTAVPSDKVGEYLTACREQNEGFDFIEMDVRDEAGNLVGRKFCPAKINASGVESFMTAIHGALSLYYIQTRMSKDEKYQNVSHIKAVN
jgi:hypothetical protein